jgi:hypothetical protein
LEDGSNCSWKSIRISWSQLTAALQHAALPFEVDADIYPNIVSACVTEQILYTSSWLREGVYKDVLDAFDYRPAWPLTWWIRDRALSP